MVVVVFLLGHTLLDRLRGATFAMLGLTTAVGLVLVALILQQGWPSVFGGPLPGFPGERSADEIASAAPGSSGSGVVPVRQSQTGATSPRTGSGDAGSGESRPLGSEVAASAPVVPSPDTPAPSDDAPAPPPATPAPIVEDAPAPSPAPVATATSPPISDDLESASSPSTSGDPSKGKGNGKGKGYEKGRGSGKDRSPSVSKPKSSAPKPKSSAPKPATSTGKPSVAAVPVKPPPPVHVPGKDEKGTVPTDEKHGSDSVHGPSQGKGK